MNQPAHFLAVDIGAASGRVILGIWDGAQFSLRELYRFPNGPLTAPDQSLRWDVQQLWQAIQIGFAQYAAQYDAPLAGIGIDTWAVDYGLFDPTGQLLANPFHYRDTRTVGMPSHVDATIPPAELYALTGIQRLPLNTLYQLVAEQHLSHAATLLLMPDLFHYWLSGQRVAEYTNASTTMLLNATTRQWEPSILARLHLPTHLLPPLVAPGTILGPLLPSVQAAAGLHHAPPIIAVGTHDTASAVAAIPGLDAQSAYISSGTWSLVGVELPAPILTPAAQRANFTNEGGVNNTIRFLKNVGGLWLVQECQRHWSAQGEQYTWAELIDQAAAATPLRSLIDPDAPAFMGVGDMPAQIRSYCQQTNQPIPDTVGAMVRCCLESLALKYRWVINHLEQLTGRQIRTIRIVGGGSQNALLCQFIADACHCPVIAGPTEGTALGNILVQAIATRHISDLAAGRAAVAASVAQISYHPHAHTDWDAAIIGFDALLAASDRSA
jgi:rhamnulokinase